MNVISWSSHSVMDTESTLKPRSLPCFPRKQPRVIQPEDTVQYKNVQRYGETNIRHVYSPLKQEQWRKGKTDPNAGRKLPDPPQEEVMVENQLRELSPRRRRRQLETEQYVTSSPQQSHLPQHRPNNQPLTADFYVSVPIFNETLSHSYRKKNEYVYVDHPDDDVSVYHQSLSRGSSLRDLRLDSSYRLDRPDSSRRFDGSDRLDSSRRFDGSDRLDSSRRFDGSDRLDNSRRFDGSDRLNSSRRFDGSDRLDNSRRFEKYDQLDSSRKFEKSNQLESSHRFDGSDRLDQLESSRRFEKYDQLESSNRSDRLDSSRRFDRSNRLDSSRRLETSHFVTSAHRQPTGQYERKRPASLQRPIMRENRHRRGSGSEASYNTFSSRGTYGYESEAFEDARLLRKARPRPGLSLDSDDEDFR